MHAMHFAHSSQQSCAHATSAQTTLGREKKQFKAQTTVSYLGILEAMQFVHAYKRHMHAYKRHSRSHLLLPARPFGSRLSGLRPLVRGRAMPIHGSCVVLVAGICNLV